MVRKPRKLATIVAALAAVSMVAVGCSSGGSTPVASSTAAASGSSTSPTGPGVPSSLVGMHIEGAEAGAWASAPFGALRLWDNGTAWSQIELEPGVYKWDNLEGILENAQA